MWRGLLVLPPPCRWPKAFSVLFGVHESLWRVRGWALSTIYYSYSQVVVAACLLLGSCQISVMRMRSTMLTKASHVHRA